jgi:hypothetical protein
MFHVTCLGWLIFRAKSVAQIGELLAALPHGWSLHAPAWREYGPAMLFYIAPLLVIHGIEARAEDLNAVPRLPLAARYAIYCGIALFVLLFGDFGGAQFIYFQF